VSWQDRPATETTWEQVDTFKLNYPDIQLADELFLGEEGNVINTFVGKTYQRRKK
jgi:transcriptional regulator GlxA family with amidase domain